MDLDPPRRARAGRWTELTLEPRFQGWDGIAHGGIVVHDPRRGHGLVARRRGQLGPHRPDERRLQASPVQLGQPIRAEGWITRSRRRIVDTEARHRRRRDRRRSSRRRRRLRRRRRGTQARAARSATATSASTRHHVRARDARRWHRPIDDRRGRREPDHRSAPSRSSPTTSPAAEALGTRLAEHIGDPDAFAAALRDRPRATSPTPSTSRASDRSRPGIGAVHGVRWPLLAAVDPRLPPGDAARPADARCCSSPTACSASPTSRRAGSPSACSSGPWPPTRSGPGSSSAAAPRGRRLDHRRRPRPSRTASGSSPSRTAGPSSSSSSTRRRAGSAGSSARRSRR